MLFSLSLGLPAAGWWVSAEERGMKKDQGRGVGKHFMEMRSGFRG